jgi:hypothetical protein
MPTVTSRRAAPDPDTIRERENLSRALISAKRAIAPHEAAIEAMEARLKVIATEGGEPFKITIEDGSYVQVSGAVAAEFKGDVPVIQTEVWQKLSPAERKLRGRGGLIKVEAQWGRASSGRVQVKIFGEAA